MIPAIVPGMVAIEVVNVLGYACRLGPGLRDHEAEDMAHEHEEDTEVEQRRRPAQDGRAHSHCEERDVQPYWSVL